MLPQNAWALIKGSSRWHGYTDSWRSLFLAGSAAQRCARERVSGDLEHLSLQSRNILGQLCPLNVFVHQELAPFFFVYYFSSRTPAHRWLGENTSVIPLSRKTISGS